MSNASSSPELNQLIQEQLATGRYQSDEDVLIAGLMALRELESRQSELRESIQRRREGIARGEGIVIEGDDAMGRFFDEIDAEVDRESAAAGES